IRLLTDHKVTLERIALELRRHETVDANQLAQILNETGINPKVLEAAPGVEAIPGGLSAGASATAEGAAAKGAAGRLSTGSAERVRRGVIGKTALDIGAGVGAVHIALLSAGAVSATDVDVSAAYLKAAQSEATRLGFAERTRYVHGDFVQQAENIEPADVVTL